MSTFAITTVLEARSIANEWLISNLPDRFAAGIPEYDHDLHGWRIPVWLSYPGLEALGPLGELVVDESGTLSSHTPVDEMKHDALKLYDQHRDQIEARFLKQETRYSCAPACLRMVLSAFGIQVDEAPLRHLADCSPLAGC